MFNVLLSIFTPFEVSFQSLPGYSKMPCNQCPGFEREPKNYGRIDMNFTPLHFCCQNVYHCLSCRVGLQHPFAKRMATTPKMFFEDGLVRGHFQVLAGTKRVVQGVENPLNIIC